MATASYDAFYQHQPLLFSIAYRMVGTVADAEDIVQEVLIDWYPKVEQELDIESQKSYLAAMVIRKSIDYLRHAYVQRESYFGTWLPEPIVCNDPHEYTERLVLKDNVSLAWMLLLERLSPLERAIYILRTAFDFDYKTIAEYVGKQADNCRKIMQRAQQRIMEGKPEYDISDEQHRCVVQEFLRAANSGDIEALLDTLLPGSTFISDGGGKIAAAVRKVHGADRIGRFMLGIRKKGPHPLYYQIVIVNGDYGILAWDETSIQYVMAMAFRNGKIATIYSIRNPDKLRHVHPNQARR